MNTRRLLFLLLFCGLTHLASAQVAYSGWLASFNTVRLNDRLSLHFDAQLRSTDALEQVQTLILRPGLNYHINKRWTATLGYAFIPNRRTLAGVSSLLTEHRTWQQLLYSAPLGRASQAHRLRLEERFIPQPLVAAGELEKEGHDESLRLRYFNRFLLPFRKTAAFERGFFGALQNEVFLNLGGLEYANGRTFDQNRLYAAIGYRLPNKIDLEVGYLNQYVATRTSSALNHIAQLAVYRRL